MFKIFLKKALAFGLSLLISAGIISTCLTEHVSADSPYSFSATYISKDTGHGIGEYSSGILTIGKQDSGKGLQAININLNMLDKSFEGSLQYRICVYKKGWQDWTDNGQITGVTTMPNLITGIQMRLVGELADAYSIWYSAWTDLHKDSQGWVCDGAIAGSGSETRKIEELRVMLVRRNRMNGYTNISFRCFMQKFGWDKTWQYSGHPCGRAGKGKRLEGFELSVIGSEYTGSIRYRSRVSGSGWLGWVSDGEFCGKRSKRMEAIEIELTGEVSYHYDVYYRTYSGGLGWFAWAKNGEPSGTTSLGKRIEAIQIALVRKGGDTPGALDNIKSTIGYKHVAPNSHAGVSEWKITTTGDSNSFASTVLRRAKHYNRTEYKDMRCDALVAQVLVDALGSNLGKARKKSKYPRLNEWIGLSALESLLSSNFTYKDSAGRTVICRPVSHTKLKRLYKKTWKRKEKKITEDELNTWLRNNCKPGDILIFYNKKKKPIHCGIYSGIQTGSLKDYEYFHGRKKGEKESDIRPGPYMWHSGYDTGVANKYVFWAAAEIGGRFKYIRRYRVDSGKSQPAAPVQN